MNLRFALNLLSVKKNNKRLLLSNQEKIFDTLGWLSQVVGKLFMQRLWLEEINWDQELDVNGLNEWKLYEENLKLLEEIRILRWIKTHVNFSVQPQWR